jgi:NAD(P)H-flavin reductase
LTKRFGIVGISQMPIQYLLALKSLNPFGFIFGTSHEHVNRWHRTLGRIIYLLLACHAILYLNAFVQLGVMKLRMLAPVVALGEAAFLSLSLMQITAFSSVRHASYRVFFVVHIAVAFVLPALIFFHAGSARKYVVEALVVLLLDLGARKIDTIASQATVESIAGTSLVKVTAAVPQSKLSRFRALPGGHVYLNIPGASRHVSNPLSPSYLLFELLYNPFTVASVNEQKSEVTLVARCLTGPTTTALARLCKTSASSDGKGVRLNLEGPYGTLHRLSDRAREEFDRVLLVAGGVGATHIVPVYRVLLRDNPSAKLEMVWAVRTPGDATWAATTTHGIGSDILNDDNVAIYVTDSIADSETGPGSRTRSQSASMRNLEDDVNGHARNGVEMTATHRDRGRNRHTRSQTRRRPNLGKVVDDVFRHGSEERVAVLVCGPSSMTSELREHVGVWVMKGRVVYWHAESFGW